MRAQSAGFKTLCTHADDKGYDSVTHKNICRNHGLNAIIQQNEGFSSETIRYKNYDWNCTIGRFDKFRCILMRYDFRITSTKQIHYIAGTHMFPAVWLWRCPLNLLGVTAAKFFKLNRCIVDWQRLWYVIRYLFLAWRHWWFGCANLVGSRKKGHAWQIMFSHKECARPSRLTYESVWKVEDNVDSAAASQEPIAG